MSLTMQEWFFSESAGKFSINLGGSNVEPRTLNDILGNKDISSLLLDYGYEAGLPELRQTIADNYQNINSDNVMVCHGGQEAFTLLIRALGLSHNNEILVLGSGWTQHVRFPEEYQSHIKFINTDDYDEDKILSTMADAVTWRTKAVVVANPDNPTGRKTSLSLLESLSEVASAYDALLIIDEEYIVDYRESAAGLSDNIAITSSLSKMYGLPGLRVGWCITRPSLIKSCLERKHLSTITNSVLCESLALLAFQNKDKLFSKAILLCQEGKRILASWAENQQLVSLTHTNDTLPYAWLQLDNSLNSLSFSRKVLKKGVLVMPGEVFDKPGFLRIAIGIKNDDLQEGLYILGQTLTLDERVVAQEEA